MSQLRDLLLLAPLGLVLTATTAAAQTDSTALHQISFAPMAIDSKGPGRGGYASIAEFYSSLNGRTMWMQEFTAGYGFSDALSLWIGRQNYLIHGHTAGSRFELQDNEYGGKWVIVPARNDRARSIAAEFTVVIPGTGSGVKPTAGESFSYDATKDISGAVDYGFGHGWESQLLYGSVKGAGTGSGNAYGLAAGKDLKLGTVDIRLQAQLVDDNFTDGNGLHHDNTVRPVLYANAGWDALKWLRLEADGTLFTSGMPLAGSDFTGISSFMVYSPPSPASELRSDAVGILSFRLTGHWRF